MTTITWPSNTKSVIDSIRDAIGRDITIYVSKLGTPCPVCSLDPITNLSVNPFCPTCSGFYWINTESGFVVNAHVTNLGGDTPVWVPGGIIMQGDCRISITYSDDTYDAVMNSVRYIVDGRTYLQKDVSLRGVPEINRIVVTLEEQEG